MFWKKLSFTLVGLLGLWLAVSSLWAQEAPVTYDLNTDWSDTDNPNSPWAYLEGSNPGNPLPHVDWWQRTLGGWRSAQPGWARSEDGNNRLPFWFQSNGTETFDHDWLPGDIIVHTHDPANGVGNGLANLSWTSPADGRVAISGAVWNGRNIGRGNDWFVYLNHDGNERLLSTGRMQSGDGHTRDNPFDLADGSGGPDALQDIAVTAGDVIRLGFVRTTESGDFVGINLTIELTPTP